MEKFASSPQCPAPLPSSCASGRASGSTSAASWIPRCRFDFEELGGHVDPEPDGARPRSWPPSGSGSGTGCHSRSSTGSRSENKVNNCVLLVKRWLRCFAVETPGKGVLEFFGKLFWGVLGVLKLIRRSWSYVLLDFYLQIILQKCTWRVCKVPPCP